LASGLDEEKERMILEALKPIADILGKRTNMITFLEGMKIG